MGGWVGGWGERRTGGLADDVIDVVVAFRDPSEEDEEGNGNGGSRVHPPEFGDPGACYHARDSDHIACYVVPMVDAVRTDRGRTRFLVH